MEDYKALLRNLRPQVVEGARWIARTASNMTDLIELATEEQIRQAKERS